MTEVPRCPVHGTPTPSGDCIRCVTAEAGRAARERLAHPEPGDTFEDLQALAGLVLMAGLP